MTDKLQQLQEEHSALCAKAIDLKVKVPADLTVDFDTEETGRTVVASLRKLVSDAEWEASEKNGDGVAQTPAEVQDTENKPKAKKAKAKPAAKAAQQESEKTMAKTAKKAKAKKAPAKKTVKKVAKKAAKKATAKKAPKARNQRDGTKISKVIAKMKNGGITRKQALAILGWKAISMQQVAGYAGLTVKKSAERPFKYTAK